MVILLSFMQLRGRQTGEEMDCVDLFAGAARVAKLTRALGMKAKALDIAYHSNHAVFDMNQSAGFLRLAWVDLGL